MMSSVAFTATKLTSKFLPCARTLNTSRRCLQLFTGISAPLQTQRRLTRSIWHMCNSHVRATDAGKPVSSLHRTCGCCALHTEGDKEISAFLAEEIELERKNSKDGGKLPTVKGFTVASKDGANMTLTKKMDGETVTLKFNVNHSVEDEGPGEAGEEQQSEAGPLMVSRPPFIVEINRDGSDRTLAIQCIFPEDDLMAQQEGEDPGYMDMIEIQEVAILEKGQTWDDKVYTVSGQVMDGNLYDMLLNLMEERGVDGDCVDQMVNLSTTYEHNQYVGFLGQLKDFVDK